MTRLAIPRPQFARRKTVPGPPEAKHQERDPSRKATTRFAVKRAASMTKILSIGPFNTGQ